MRVADYFPPPPPGLDTYVMELDGAFCGRWLLCDDHAMQGLLTGLVRRLKTAEQPVSRAHSRCEACEPGFWGQLWRRRVDEHCKVIERRNRRERA